MRIVLGWVGAVLVLAAAIVGGVAIANATVFSASGFARDYLDALSAGRVDDVLALPGVDAEGLDEGLLQSAAVQPFDYELIGDTETSDVHRVVVSFTVGGLEGRATLELTRIGTRFALFPEWGFATSPVTPLTVTTTGDTRFRIGEVPLEAPDGGPVSYAALTPGGYRLAHSSEFLTADPVDVLATGEPSSVELAIEPTAAFTAAVQDAMEADLAACTEQVVLFPTGCPFGYAIENRVVSQPVWTIAEMPTAVIAASDRIGVWAVPPADGVAHLSVKVQSLFDGSVSTLEKDVPFDASYLIGFDGDQVVLAPGY